MREPSPDGLNPSRVLAFIGQHRDAARHQHARQIMHGSKRHHHCRQPFVASRNAKNSLARRQRSYQSSKNSRSIVAIRQAIEHSGSALGAPVAGIGAVSRKRYSAGRLQLRRSRLHQESNLPMPSVIPESNRSPIGRTNPTMCRKNQKLFRAQFRSIPPHPGILSPSKQIPRRPLPKNFRGQRQRTNRPSRVTLDIVKRRIRSIKEH